MVFSFFADACPCTGETHNRDKEGFPVYGKLRAPSTVYFPCTFSATAIFYRAKFIDDQKFYNFTITITNTKEET